MAQYLVNGLYYMSMDNKPINKSVEKYIQDSFKDFMAVKNMGFTIEPQVAEIELYDIIEAKTKEELGDKIWDKFPDQISVLTIWKLGKSINEAELY